MSGKAKEVGIERKNFVGPVCEFIMSGDSNFHHMGIVHHCFFGLESLIYQRFLKMVMYNIFIF